MLFPSFRSRMKVWFCWTKSLTTWACWRGSSSVCRSENPARPSPPSQPIRTLLWAHCSSAPHFRLSHVDLGDCCLDSDREHLYRCFHFGLVFHFSQLICLSFVSQRWLEPEKPLKKQIKGIWISKIHVFFEKYIYKSNLPWNMFQFIMIKMWKNILSSRKMNWFCTTCASFSWQVWLLPFMWTSEYDSSSLIPILCSMNRRGVYLCLSAVCLF